MNKINGYTEEEAKAFVRYVCTGRRAGKTLTSIFDGYARKSGRAKGSVRNYYYALLRTDNKEVKKLLKGTDLKAESICAFTDEETDRILKAILTQKSKGVSVRQAVYSLSGGDGKLMLRYQNKYRNVLTKQPERIKKLMRDCGLPQESEAESRVKEEIDGLYNRLSSSLKQQNAELNSEVKRLTEENALLKLRVNNLRK